MLVMPSWEMCRIPHWNPPHHNIAIRHYLPVSYEYPEYPVYTVAPSCQVDYTNLSQQYSPPTSQRTPTPQNQCDCQCEWIGCKESFDSIQYLSAHIAKKHSTVSSDGMFYCRWRHCQRTDKGFNARYKMLVHVRIHTNDKPHECPHCQKCFSRAENLKIHIRSHSGEKPYICPIQGCEKAYSNSSDRFKHMRTHTEDKPYACKVIGCFKRYTDPSSLRKHVKTYKHYTERCRDSNLDSCNRYYSYSMEEKLIDFRLNSIDLPLDLSTKS